MEKENTSKTASSAKLSHELLNKRDMRIKASSVHSMRLLLGFAANIDYKNEQATQLSFHKADIVRFMGIGGYRPIEQDAIIMKAVSEIAKEGIEEKIVKDKRIYFMIIPWLSKCSHEESNPDVINVIFNPEVIKHLNGSSAYFNMASRIYLQLESSSFTLLYMMLKDYERFGKRKMHIDDVIFRMSLNGTKSYSKEHCVNWKQNVLSRVLGIRKNKSGEWEYVTDKKGNAIGAMATISRLTDIEVMASCGKDNMIEFTIRPNEENKTLIAASASLQAFNQNQCLAQTNSAKKNNSGNETSKKAPVDKYKNAQTQEQMDSFIKNTGYSIEQVLRMTRRRFDEESGLYVTID